MPSEECLRTFTLEDAERLAALESYRILDTEREPAYDDIAAIAADILEAPIAVVNLIAADRQWFKAEIGIGKRELPLDVSICRFALLQRDILVVNDLSADERFSENPLVREAGGLRFYAGALLQTEEGLPLGTLCVLDTAARPHGISARQERALCALASQTMVQLELRRRDIHRHEELKRLRELEARLQTSETDARSTAVLLEAIGASSANLIYAKDLGFRTIYANPATLEVFGKTADEVLGRTSAELAGDPTEGVHHLDHDREVVERGRTIVVDETYTTADGVTRVFRSTKSPLKNASGDTVGVVGVSTDVTDQRAALAALRKSEEQLRLVTDALPVMIAFVDRDVRYRFVNAAYERWFGLSQPDLIGQRVEELLGADAYALRHDRIQAALRGEPQIFDAFTPHPDGTTRDTEMQYVPRRDQSGEVDGFFVLVTDVSFRKRGEEALQKRSEQLQQLAETATQVARAPSLDATLEIVTQAARRIVGAHQGVVSLTRGPDWSQAINTVALTSKYQRWLDYAQMPDGSGIYAWLCEENRPARFTQSELEAHPRWRGFGRHADEHPPMRGWLAAPLVGRDGRNLGLIQLSDKEDGSDFDEADEAMLVQLAQLASAAVEQAQTEEALARKALEFEALAENVSQLAWMAEPDGHIFWYNKRWYDYTGTDLETMQGWGWRDVHHSEHVEQVLDEVRRNWASGEPWEGTYLLRGVDGDFRPFLTRAEPIRDEAGKLVRWFGTNTDISAQLEAERELRQLNETLEERVTEALAERRLWADVFETSDAKIAALDLEGRFLALNRAYGDEFETIFGRRPEPGDVLADLLNHLPEERHAAVALWNRALTGEAFTVTEDFGDPALNRRYYELRFNPLRTQGGRLVGAFQYGIDVTEQLRSQAELAQAQEALRQSQKMESLGQLVGGIAHDFNNLLTGVIGSLDLIERRVAMGRSDKLDRYTATAMASAKRAATLTERLLAFSRRQSLDPKPLDLNTVVRSMEDLIRRSVGERIAVETVVSGGLWGTKVDRNQLENALLNLCVNARDAMSDGGRLTIETANGHLDDAYASLHPDVHPGQYVVLSVTDTGVGMSEAIKQRIFEPFYTTKPIGKGTGLGLSQLFGFVKQSGGHVAVYSEPGEGTSFKLYLRRHHGEVVEDLPSGPSELSRAESNETVLVVEDEDTVRLLVVDVLDELGYDAHEATDAEAALRVLESNARIDLLVTDVGLPGLNGRQLADRARELRPGLKILFITGYAHNAAVGNGLLEPGMEVVTKPFAVEQLVDKIGRMIREPK